HTFGATLKTAGSQSITATDMGNGAIAGTQLGITVNPAAATHFMVTSYPSPTTAGTFNVFLVTALDPYGNVATGYTGTVHTTSSDPQVGDTADYTFQAPDQGSAFLGATLATAGFQSLTVTDVSNSGITGTQSGIQVNAAAADHFQVDAPASAVSGV